MRFNRKLQSLVVTLALIVSVGCANATRRLAVAGYQTAQTALVVQTQAEGAYADKMLPRSVYEKFLAGQDKLADAGLVYSKALVAYIAMKDTGTKSELAAALAALTTALASLPDYAENALFKAKVQAQIINATPALADAKKAVN